MDRIALRTDALLRRLVRDAVKDAGRVRCLLYEIDASFAVKVLEQSNNGRLPDVCKELITLDVYMRFSASAYQLSAVAATDRVRRAIEGYRRRCGKTRTLDP
jgi:chemotaxis response regulator CheB